MRSKIYIMMLILVYSTLISGCATFSAKVPQWEVNKKHNILIVPFKAPPITIHSWGPGTFLLFGPLGARAADETSQEKRERIAETLNKIRGKWDPTVIIAKECLNLLKKGTVVQIDNAVVVNTRELPGAEDLRLKEPKVFTAMLGGFGRTLDGDWMNAGSRWFKKDISTIQYRQDYPQSNADWALEVASSYIMIRKGKVLEFTVLLKLFNTNSRERIAVGGVYDTFQISPIKEISNFKIFEEEFRIAANQLCGRALSKMGLISMP